MARNSNQDPRYKLVDCRDCKYAPRPIVEGAGIKCTCPGIGFDIPWEIATEPMYCMHFASKRANSCNARITEGGEKYRCNRKVEHTTRHATIKDNQVLAIWCTCTDCKSPAPDLEE